MVRKPRILVVDDDKEICDLLKDYLQQYDYRISVAHDGRGMRKVLKEFSIDLIVLDIMLPGEDGIALCRELREQSEVSIIMLRAAGSEADRIVGLEVGADDYLSKPFSPRELLARIKALMRRSHGQLGAKRKAARLTSLPNIHFLSWTLDRAKQRLTTPDGINVPLSRGEYDLLTAFIEHPGRVLTRDQLLDLTTGKTADPLDRSIDVQVGRLRKKLEKDPKNPIIILTVRGGGYQFTPEVSEG